MLVIVPLLSTHSIKTSDLVKKENEYSSFGLAFGYPRCCNYHMNINKKRRIALVLGGGGIKATAYHIGVCMALKEKGFSFAGGNSAEVNAHFPKNKSKVIRTYVGSSAGSFVASMIACGYPIESLMNAFEVGLGENSRIAPSHPDYLKPLGYRHIFNINGSNMIKSIPSLMKKNSLIKGGVESYLKIGFTSNGIFTTDGIEKYVRKNFIYNSFQDLGVELYIIATQLNHSRKVIFGNFPSSTKTKHTKYINYANISEAIACSTALPPVFSPYGIKKPDGKTLYFIDGEVRDTLSAHVATDKGSDLVISSYSMHPYHFTKEVGSLHNYGMPAIINQALYQVMHQKIEKHLDQQNKLKSIFNTIDGYFEQTQLPKKHRDKLKEIIAAKINFNSETDYIDIHPDPNNYEMFFADHFSLNKEILHKIFRAGFKSGIHALRKYNL